MDNSSRRWIIAVIIFSSMIIANLYRYYDADATPSLTFDSDLEKLSAVISTKIRKRQNPKNCEKARLLVYDIKWWPCGFGCTVHVTLQHFLLAFYTNRTFVLKSKGWGYDRNGWEHFLMPFGKCDHNGAIMSLPEFSDNTSDARIVRSAEKKLYHKYDWKIPRNILAKLKKNNHRDPYAWWLGQFIKYILRLQPWFLKKMTEKERRIPMTNSTVGLQIRWGDKVREEAKKYPVSEYMDFASKWFKKKQSSEKTVYVATEQSEAWRDLKGGYRSFSFVGAGYVNLYKQLDYWRGDNYAQRKYELEAILTDIYFLSKCPYVVCTLSSNICRLLYEIMATQANEPQNAIQSLDRRFYWLARLPKLQAVEDYVAAGRKYIDLKIGDKFACLWGSIESSSVDNALGTNTRTGQKGRVPLSILEVVVEPLNFDL